MSSIIILFVLIVSSYTIFFRSQQPLVKAEKEAFKIAKETAGVQRLENFYWYNGKDETYFTVEGYTNEKKLIYVIIKQDGADTFVFDAEDMITEQESKSILQEKKEPFRILESRLGITEETPFWEIAYKNSDHTISYILISAQTGETIREYNNI